MSITYPPELLPSPDEGQGADVWVKCPCGCCWDPTMLASCPVCDQKEIKDPRDAEISKLKSQLEEARRSLKVALHALKNVDGPFIVHDGEHGIFLAKEHDCTCWDAEQTISALLSRGGE